MDYIRWTKGRLFDLAWRYHQYLLWFYSVWSAPFSRLAFSYRTGTSLQLSYYKGNRQYHLFLPYDQSLMLAMIPLRMEMFRDGKYHNLTQEPGVPYLLSCKKLQAEYLRATNTLTGQVQFWLEDEIPGFCLSLLATE